MRDIWDEDEGEVDEKTILLMLGRSNNQPSLLVEVTEEYDPNDFEFFVHNGCWRGRFKNNKIYIALFNSTDEYEDEPVDVPDIFIISDDQSKMGGHYNDVFERFEV